MSDLVFTDNPSQIKHSQSIPGISDRAYDCEVYIQFTKKTRNVYLFLKQTGNACEILLDGILE